MRLKSGSGVEYGTDWVIEEIIAENLDPAEFDEMYESLIEDIYGETVKIGSMEYSTVDAIKNIDSITWRIGKDEYVSSLEEDEGIIIFDNGVSCYWTHEVESFIEEEEAA